MSTAERPGGSGRSGPLRALGALLVVLGLVAALVAAAVMTVLQPDDAVSATASSDGAPVLVTAAGVPESRPGPVEVTATGEGPVRLVVGQEDDATAWIGGAQHTTATRLATETELATETTAGEPTAPDPQTADLWVQQAEGEGSASLTYDRDEGSWLVLATGDGTGPAPDLTLTWTAPVTPDWALPLLVAGLVALALGVVLLLLARRRGRTARDDPDDSPAASGATAARPAGEDS